MPKPDIQSRFRFFDKQVHMKKWKDMMCGNNENLVIEMFDFLDYKAGKDYIRQYPFGSKFVMDFAFVNEKVCIEVDGKNHNSKKQIELDRVRDIFFYQNDWVVLRIPEKKFLKNRSFFKSLIREVVEARREQYNSGFLHKIDVPDFREEEW